MPIERMIYKTLIFFRAENANRVRKITKLDFFCNKESSKGGRRKKEILSRRYYL